MGPTDGPFSMFVELPPHSYDAIVCGQCDWSYSSSSYSDMMEHKVAHHRAEHTELY